ncbi:alkaline phosphatase D family protein [Novosphingobium mathurense]|uniref:alkaline phosphatase D family protein n=1 Tax=Novosphingobium mathurense TaxID=428990 RepID=UPI00159200B8|nr:alkaline phosphatase D family protein [Novosphingobium mathurense]
MTDTIHATLLSGEPGPSSIILQARISSALATPGDFASDSPGLAGEIRFEFSDNPAFAQAQSTKWKVAERERDYIVQQLVEGLTPATTYYFRVAFRSGDGRSSRPSAVGSFATLPAADTSGPLSFVVMSCLSYELFYGIGKPAPYPIPRADPPSPEERRRGYPAMDLIRQVSPAFLLATGDTVYYDHPSGDSQFWAVNVEQMRQKWHRQLAVPSVKETFAAVPTFFMKDDHDFRYDDADNTGVRLPTAEEGKQVFLEQVPVVQGDQPTYRTVRVNRHLQIWLLENRDYRSPNDAPNTPEKTIWGLRQRKWLEDGLLECDADFKLIISPGPMVGPDDARKSDNQVSESGFLAEGEAFLNFLKDHGLEKSTFILNGDRHWKYHSIHPTGVEEFSCGTINGQNSRPGVAPGDPRGTDPNARIRQPYLQPIPDGGFLQVSLTPDADGKKSSLLFQFWGEHGALQYAVRRWGDREPIKVGPWPKEAAARPDK